ncbi:hypothetical protein BABINDRAFT_177327 [Babjeviella inositovora NRRL Y-12698]|uniref:FF domain-containing protein n=1 Tax=Babjeviella inositovora NRRL Y-12698 TaxID=984486 RepID=A0A1E3QLM6_9ASCO|nr:uncharacterized protein BABINDRAFT_177327 [Babjeviella inositovora NRRL Y-12698]ODQ78591.1 hypothetical protein BABINDRAFT_177327 [Babjeviella inositovora NRRL Y-12698]
MNQGKVPKIHPGQPQFRYPIPETAWSVVITTTGHHFYHNSAEGRSVWKIEDDTLRLLLYDKINRDELLLLIARARGLNVEAFVQPTDKSAEESEVVFQIQRTGIENEPETLERMEEAAAPVGAPKLLTSTLLSGYASSSEDDAPEDVPEVAPDDSPEEAATEESESSDKDIYNGDLDLGLSDGEELAVKDTAQSREMIAQFKQLFDRYQLNPFNGWDTECESLASEPLFFEISDDKVRLKIFNEWCKEKNLKAQTRDKSDQEELHDRSIASLLLQASPSTNPKYVYLRFLESTMITDLKKLSKRYKLFLKFKFYIDFKRKYRTDEAFKATSLSDKEKEKCFREYIGLFNKTLRLLDDETLGETFSQNANALLLTTVSHLKVLNVQLHHLTPPGEELSAFLDEFKTYLAENSAVLSTEEYYKLLSLLVRELMVPDSFLEDVNLFLVDDIRARLATIFEYCYSKLT